MSNADKDEAKLKPEVVEVNLKTPGGFIVPPLIEIETRINPETGKEKTVVRTIKFEAP